MRSNFYIFLSSVAFLLLGIAIDCPSQNLAFPTAEGGGMYTSGGRGGKVLYVTNLSDSGEKGSFRWAVTRKYPRTVIFKVSGIIKLDKKLLIRSDNLTIAGQTAPGDGITIKGYPVRIQANNIIIRYIRFRLGDDSNESFDAIQSIGQKDIIIDHCSISWGVDENASFYANQNFTLQWSIISESLNQSVHEKGDHGYGGIWGGKDASFHHNLLANNNSRNPRFDHPGIYDSEEDLKNKRGAVEFSNNVIYNWHNHASYGGEDGSFNVINNYYKSGKDSKRIDTFLKPYKEEYNYGRFYVKGNILEGRKEVEKNNRLGIEMPTNDEFNTIELEAPLNVGGSLKIDKAKKAYKKVLEKAGASLSRDAVDKRIVHETRSKTSTYKGSVGNIAGIIDSPSNVGGYPNLQSLSAPKDSDNDGIPDSWEIKHKLDPANENDANKINKQGYTMLELYLNSLVK